MEFFHWGKFPNKSPGRNRNPTGLRPAKTAAAFRELFQCKITCPLPSSEPLPPLAPPTPSVHNAPRQILAPLGIEHRVPRSHRPRTSVVGRGLLSSTKVRGRWLRVRASKIPRGANVRRGGEWVALGGGAAGARGFEEGSGPLFFQGESSRAAAAPWS